MMNLRAFLRLLCGATVLSFSLCASAFASILPFPGAYPTIQATIDAAANGDTVLVADGTYTGNGNRDIDFHGKSLTVTSQNGPTKTIIDCGGFASTDGSGNHRGFYIHSGETNATISGFTVKNGYETDISSIPDSDTGGGIFNQNTSGGTISLDNCIITGNTVDGSGGGIFNENDNENGVIILTNCNVTKNAANSGDGGGISNWNYNSIDGEITLSNCTVAGNSSFYGGGIANHNFNGSGDIKNGIITQTNCIILDNLAFYIGGGIYNSNNVGSFTIGDENGTIIQSNCTISVNIAYERGSGIFNENQSFSEIQSITPPYNGTITLNNDIIYSDTGGEVISDYYTSNAAATYSDIQGGYPGTGNIDADPQFVRAPNLSATPPDYGDLHLKPGSPCLGKGTPTGAPATDLDGNPRPNPPSMGAYDRLAPATITGFTLSPNQINAPGSTVTVVADVTTAGQFSKVTVSPAPGSLGGASPTFTLVNSGADWKGTLPTAYLKLAKTNPITFIATGTRVNGTTTSTTATLQVGPLPTLTLSLVPDVTSIHRNQIFNLNGYVSDLSTVSAPKTTVQVTLPVGINYVSSNGFTYDVTAKTLTLAVSPLSPNGGTYPISIMLQAASNAPEQTPLFMPASASCTGFQTATQNPAVVAEAGLAPLGVDVDTTGGYGILDGTADVDLSQGNTPLNATLTPFTSLSNLFTLYGNTHRASIYLEVKCSVTGSATCVPSGVGVSKFLAENDLMSPSVSPTYAATFSNINDSVSISVSFNARTAILTFADSYITYLATVYQLPIPTADQIISFANDLSQISAFSAAAEEFAGDPPKNNFQRFSRVAAATRDILTIDSPDKQLLINILKKYGVKIDKLDVLQDGLSAVFGVNTLLHVVADAFTIEIASEGQPMVVRFAASPVPTK